MRRPGTNVPGRVARKLPKASPRASLRARGAAMMILDRELSATNLSQAIAGLRADPERLATMARAARTLGRPDAAERVVDVCLKLVEKKEEQR